MYKEDFPIFKENRGLVYLDTAASAQKPEVVLNSMKEFASSFYANVHRGIYFLSEKSTQFFEDSRKCVADFFNVQNKDIIFVRGATEGINLVAQTYGRTLVPGDEILVSESEHHSNLVPWQLLAKEKNLNLKFFKVLENGQIDFLDFQSKISKKTKLVAITQMSNVLGIMNPIQKIIKMAHQYGSKVLVDGAQGVAHSAVDLNKIHADFYTFSAHKLYGPTGIGVLYAPSELMSDLPPWQGGGDMVKSVSLNRTEFASSPARFEAGTPAVVEAVGLATALNYIREISFDKIKEQEKKIMNAFKKELALMSDVKFLGDISLKESLFCFNIEGLHPQDIAMLLSEQNIAVRVGHHCAQPITEKYGVNSSIRVSLGLYNDLNDVDAFFEALKKTRKILTRRKNA